MNPYWLSLIIPFSVALGYFIAAFEYAPLVDDDDNTC